MSVIHIVENLDHGAVENWLVGCFLQSRQMKHPSVWTFYCILGKEGRLDNRVRSAGGIIIYCPVPISKKIKFLRHLRKVIKQGNYDIVHAHHDYLSGFYGMSLSGLSFYKKVLHIHNTDKALPIGRKWVNDLMLGPTRWLALHMFDQVVGISQDTLDQFVSGTGFPKERTSILYYGIDLERFRGPFDQRYIRDAFDIPRDAYVLIFVGRMNELKNPVFVVDILGELTRRGRDFYAVFVGEGDLKKDVVSRAEEKSVTTRVRVCGWRDDIPQLMGSADAFVFPRVEEPKEGLGLVVVEAQASGKPVFISGGIVPDAIEVPEQVHQIRLSNNAGEWADKISGVLENGVKADHETIFKKMNASKFSLAVGTRNLLTLYEK